MINSSRVFSTAALLLFGLCSASPAEAAETCDNSDAVDIWSADPLPSTKQIEDGTEQSKAKAKAIKDTPLKHVFLVDNSLSMYAGYSTKNITARRPQGTPDPGQLFYVETDDFHTFIANDVGATFRDGKDTALVMTFETSAHVWGAGGMQKPVATSFENAGLTSREELRTRLKRMRKPENTPGQKSMMLDGLNAAKTVLGDETGRGVIWLVTDNIYDGIGKGSDSVDTSETDENRRFYEAIRDDDSFRVVVAYPVVQRSGGAWLEDTSLFVYGIYFDADTSRETPREEVRWMLGDGVPGVLASKAHTTAMKKYSADASPSPGEPFRLKPLDQDVVRISLKQEVTQVEEFQQMGQPVQLKATLTIENLLNHRIIDSVRFKVDNDVWAGWEPAAGGKGGKLMDTILPACAGSFDTSESLLDKPVGPGESREIDVVLTMPPVDYEIKSPGDALEIGMNEFVVMGGVLHADLLEMKSHLAISPEAFKGTYGAESLPDVFRNPDVRSYKSEFVGRTEPIENPGTIMALALLGLGGLGTGLFLLGGWMMRSVGRRLRIDGTDKGAVSISRLRATPIQSGGRTIARTKLTMGGNVKVSGANGYVAKRGSSGWNLTKAGEAPVSVQLRTRR